MAATSLRITASCSLSGDFFFDVQLFFDMFFNVRIHRESGNGVPIHLENLEGWEVGGGGWEHRKMVGGGGWGEGGGNIGNGVLFFERRFLL